MANQKITIFENGPCVIAGTATYIDADGNEQQTPGSSVALCRCGNSANKPFCDGVHKKIEFTAPGVELEIES